MESRASDQPLDQMERRCRIAVETMGNRPHRERCVLGATMRRKDVPLDRAGTGPIHSWRRPLCPTGATTMTMPKPLAVAGFVLIIGLVTSAVSAER